MLKWWNRWLTDDKRAIRTAPLIEELEPRVLLSADAAGVFAPDPAGLEQQPPTERLLDDSLEPAPSQQVVQQENRSLELVFVDTDSPDYQAIVDSLTDVSDASRQFEVIVLDNNRDGVWQVSQALQAFSNVDAIHLVSHGDSDGVDLGNTRLDGTSLAVQQDQFLAWANHLAADADILIYGCNLASGDSGLSLMRELAHLTGADVAASEDLTGHSSLGGNWVLEVRVGAVDTQVFASQGLLQSYRATLAAPVANDDNGDSYSEVVEGISDGYFRLGDAGNIADETAGGNDGTAVGGVSTGIGGATGDGDNSLTLNGVDGYVSIPHSADYELTEGAISLWFNSTTIVDGDTLFSKDASGTAEGGHLTMRFIGDGAAAEIEVRLQNNTASGTDSHFVYSDLPNGYLNDGNWHNVVFTFGPAGMALYVDGTAADTTGGNAHLDIYDGGMAGDTGVQGDGGDTPNQEPIALGASRRTSGTGMTPPSGPFFQGSIDELAIVNQQLTPAQVAELYGTPGVPYVVDEDGTLAVNAANGVLFNDTDADGDTLTASLVSGPGNAESFTLNSDGSFTYTPQANFSGTDSFVYQADDGNGGTDTATATITVNAVADDPALWDYHQTVSLDTATPTADYLVEVSLANVANGFQYSNADANGDDLRFYDSSGNDLDYFIESWNVAGTSTIWVEIADAGTTAIDFYYGNPDAVAKSTGSAGTGSIVTTLSAEGFSINENSPDTSPVGTVLAEDVDGDGLTFTITGGNTASAFAIDNAGLITVVNSSALDFAVNPSFALTVEVDDGTGRTDTTTVNISVNDVTAPAAAVITGISNDTNVAADGITSDNQLVFSGLAEANSDVEVFIDGSSIGTTDADGGGNWSFDHTGTTLADGSYIITAEATDASGNTGALSAGFALTVDTGAPVAPTALAISVDTGAADLITSDNQLIFNGSAEANSTVEVFLDSGGGPVSIDTVTADGSGNWTVDYSATTLADGNHTLSARSTDLAGNTGPTSGGLTFTIDTAGPSAAVSTISDDTGAADLVTEDNQLVFSGTAEANNSVEVFLDGASLGSVTADGTGNWGFDYTGATLADGSYILTARATDTATGQAGTLSAGLNFTIDSAGPSATVTAISDDTGAADLVTLDNQLVFSGTAEANNSVEVFLDGLSLGSVTADGSGNWNFDYSGTSLADGSYTLAAQATDTTTGQAGPLSGGLTFTVDTVAPTAAVSAITDDTNIGTDGVTSDTQLVFSGTAEASNSVEVFLDGASVGSVTADGSGNWSLDYTGTTLADASYTLTARATDTTTGQVGAVSGGFAFTVDSTAPAAPNVVSLSDDTGAPDLVTSDNQLVFTGTAQANSSVELLLDGGSIGTTGADGSGNWSFDYTGITLPDGSYTLTARATDLAGNTSPTSTDFDFSVDTTSPPDDPPATVDDIGSDGGGVPDSVNIPPEQANEPGASSAPLAPPANEDPLAGPPTLELSDPVLDNNISTTPLLELGDNLEIGNRAGTGSSSLSLSNSNEGDLEDDTETDAANAERNRELVEDLLQLIQDDDTEEQFILTSGNNISALLEEEAEAEEELAVVDDVLTNYALWDAIDRMNEEMVSHSDSRLTREELVVQFVSTAGLGLFAAVTVYALRGGALMASWLSTVPLWGTLDPLPVLREKKHEENNDIGDGEKSTRERKAESLFSGREHA